VDRLVRHVGYLRGRYINVLKKIGLSFLIGSSHMAHILNVKMGGKDLFYENGRQTLWDKF
jgi:hypothetical protein